MAKDKKYFLCDSCGYDTPKWMGKCPSCGKWDSFKEFKESKITSQVYTDPSTLKDPVPLNKTSGSKTKRIICGVEEFDRVVGGGLVNGMVVLIGGDPGIGKSTLMIQIASKLINSLEKITYICGEENPEQIGLRANRLGIDTDRIVLYPDTELNSFVKYINNVNSDLIIVDSIQTVFSNRVDNFPGSLAQLRESTMILTSIAKKLNIPVIMIGHVTKDGTIAGPKVLEHMVDTVLYLEGDRYRNFRILRSVKNRFGSTNESGLFEMRDSGMVEVNDPSSYFIDSIGITRSGSAFTVTLEGSRPLIIEVQALATTSSFGTPQRNCVGYDNRKLAKIVAVLEKRGGIMIGSGDLFLNITGGVKVDDSGVDLGVAVALISSFTDKTVMEKSLFIGEIGLAGEVRAVTSMEKRIKEAIKLGFKNIYTPEIEFKENYRDENIVVIKSIYELLDLF
ncbi:MAG: DNA repair protein RadA [Candidatus Cloacimonadota bacterium]|nr:MAG: DNA repair protein RadA [Candidatus Cloacimonadota bacterium]PIE77741.1 MAG: DNA repair protein RadA [Candidatus Delongbacteria bacterium]